MSSSDPLADVGFFVLLARSAARSGRAVDSPSAPRLKLHVRPHSSRLPGDTCEGTCAPRDSQTARKSGLADRTLQGLAPGDAPGSAHRTRCGRSQCKREAGWGTTRPRAARACSSLIGSQGPAVGPVHKVKEMNAFADAAEVPERLGRALPLGHSQRLLCGSLERGPRAYPGWRVGVRTLFVCLGVAPPVPLGGAASSPGPVPRTGLWPRPVPSHRFSHLREQFNWVFPSVHLPLSAWGDSSFKDGSPVGYTFPSCFSSLETSTFLFELGNAKPPSESRRGKENNEVNFCKLRRQP